MYAIKFLEYNDLMKQVMNEEDSLDNALTNLDKTTKEGKLILIIKLGRNMHLKIIKEYFATIYQNDKPIACIDNYFKSINIQFLTYNQGKLFIYLSMIYNKVKRNGRRICKISRKQNVCVK